MRASLVISLFLHLAIIVLAVVNLRGPDRLLAPPQEALPVEIVDIEEVSRRAAMRKDAPKKPKKAVEKPAPPKQERRAVEKPAPKPAKEVKQASREPRPAPEAALAPKPEPEKPRPGPEPEPQAKKKLEALVKEAVKETPPEERKAAKPEKRARMRPAPKPRARPKIVRRKPAPRPGKVARTKKKPLKDPIDDIAALLNKTDEERAAPRPESERAGRPLRGPADVNGEDARIAADIADALRARIEECWNVPAGVRDAEHLRVRIRFQLGPGGALAGGPVVLNRMDHPAFPAAAQSAVRAVIACAPYAFLPPERYDLWKDVILTFDPSRLLAVN